MTTAAVNSSSGGCEPCRSQEKDGHEDEPEDQAYAEVAHDLHPPGRFEQRGDDD